MATQYILVAIDGTDSWGWGKHNGKILSSMYDDDFSKYKQTVSIDNSYTWQFYNLFPTSSKKYWHGPGSQATGGVELGVGSDDIRNEAKRFIYEEISKFGKIGLLLNEVKLRQFNNPETPNYIDAKIGNISNSDISKVQFNNSETLTLLKEYNNFDIKIVLVGHSRGGAICIELANTLPLPIYFMGLYDAVDRSTYIETDVDSVNRKNVEVCCHALRNANLTGSREYFGTAKDTSEKLSKSYHPGIFVTTHGGIGGDVGIESKITDNSIIYDTSAANERYFRKGSGLGSNDYIGEKEISYARLLSLSPDARFRMQGQLIMSTWEKRSNKQFQEHYIKESQRVQSWMLSMAISYGKLPLPFCPVNF
jgi:hypothetical protein